ncbi:MAG: WHG domain-containing protein [Acidimicrobiia bacterium]|nr:WHG domain-containing protein [Acidimicrobiia bacterium]
MIARRGLTPETVVDAATAIVESDGMEALTLTRVAHALGVKPPSLYNHVAGLDSLRRAVTLQTFEGLGRRLGAAAMGRSGREALQAVAAEVRTYATNHPGLYELTTRARPEDEEYAAASMRAVEPVLAILRGYHMNEDEAIHAARALRSALHGFVSLENSGGFGLDVDIDESFSWLVQRLADMFEPHAAENFNAVAPSST